MKGQIRTMTETRPTFPLVRRGFDPTAVNRALAALALELETAEHRCRELEERVQALSAAPPAPSAPTTPTFAALGERVGMILTLAEQEAADIRSAAEQEAERRLTTITETNAGLRADAKRYAEEAQLNADREAARIVEDAKRTAGQMMDEAKRYSSTRRAQAESESEQLRARSAKAAADFEHVLAARRDVMEQELAERSIAAERETVAAQQLAAQIRAEAHLVTEQANARAANLVTEAEYTAERIVAEATSHAERIRTETERELAAVAQRRDAINRQLMNVRRMLAAVSGSVPGLAEADASGDDADGAAARTAEPSHGRARPAPNRSQPE